MTCNHFGQSSTIFRHHLHLRALPLRCSPPKQSLASAYPPKPHFFRRAPRVTFNHFGQISTVFKHHLHLRALLLRHSPLKRTLASAYPPKPLTFLGRRVRAGQPCFPPFSPLFALKTQLLLGAPSPNYTVQFILVRPCFMRNGIALAPWEHTSELTRGPSQLTLVGALTRKPLSQSSSKSLCNRVL